MLDISLPVILANDTEKIVPVILPQGWLQYVILEQSVTGHIQGNGYYRQLGLKKLGKDEALPSTMVSPAAGCLFNRTQRILISGQGGHQDDCILVVKTFNYEIKEATKFALKVHHKGAAADESAVVHFKMTESKLPEMV